MGGKPQKFRCVASYEREARAQGYRLVAGTDEVGRGSLFGPVYAAAVVLSPDRPVRGLRDSKIVPAEERVELAGEIRRRAVAWAVAAADVYEVDRLNIYQASRLAMLRAVERLDPECDFVLVDAVRLDSALPQRPLIHGDARCQSIAAASILAKVERDACLDRWGEVFPQYGLGSNKGYSTPEHLEALLRFGPTSLHRFSYEPVRAADPLNPPPAQAGLFEEAGAGPCLR